MFRNWITELLTLLLVLSVPRPVCARAATQEDAPTIQEQLVLIPAGNLVEVKTMAKQKLRGRLGALTTDSFELQIAKGGQLQAQLIRFDQVKRVKVVDQRVGLSTGGKIGVGALVVVGVFAVLGGIIAAAGVSN